MEEEKKQVGPKKRDIKLQELKQKKKDNPKKQNKGMASSFAGRVTEKSDQSQIVEFINQEQIRHNAYKRTKKGTQEEKIMKAIEKFEGSGVQPMVDSENISERYEKVEKLSDVIEKMAK